MSAEAEMRAAQQRANEAQRRYDAEGDRVELARLRGEQKPKELPTGEYTFTRIPNHLGETVGWRLDVKGSIAAMLVPRGERMEVITVSTDEDPDALTADLVMVAFFAMQRGGK